MKKWKRINKILGFTLIELLVTITIIGILATGAITINHTQIQKHKETKNIELVNEIGQIIRDNNSKEGNKKIISREDLISFLKNTERGKNILFKSKYDKQEYYYFGIENGSFCFGFQPKYININTDGVSDNLSMYNIFKNRVFEYCYLRNKKDLEKVDIRDKIITKIKLGKLYN